MAGHIPDPIDIGDGGSAELQDKARHEGGFWN
jgi:hypothetical protein